MKDFFNNIVSSIGLNDIVDILIVSFICYKLIGFIRDTRAQQLVKGMLVLVVTFFLSDILDLYALNWILRGTMSIGIIALVCSSMIGLSVTCATSFYQSTNVKKDTKAWYHPFIVLAPQIGFLGAFFGKPVMVVVFIAAMQSLFNWISGNSWYLLGNDPRYLGKKVIQSRFFNAGILACISVLNIVFITFIMSKMGVWPA